MRSGEAIVRFDAEGLARRTVAPIRAGSELLGAIWVAEGESPLDEEGEAELAHLAQLAAIHMLAHRASEDVKRRTRGAFVRELLDGRVPVTSNGTVAALKVDGPFTVLAFELAEDADTPPTSPERILSIVSLYCEAEHRDAMCAFVADRFWAVVPTPRARARPAELARNIVARVDRALHVRLRAGIGASVPRAGDVPRSRRSAEQALKIIARRPGSGPVVDIDDVRTHAVLLELLDVAAERPALLQGRLAELVRHDAEHNTDYVPTLRAYLDAWGDITAAGGRLGLHPNTVRYRVRRLAEISGIDLGDPDERLVLELQLRLHEEQARDG
jgi:sugar diacid utilization regulator